MSRNKVHYDVILTPEAIEILSGDSVFKGSLHDNKYLNCISVEPNGYFVDLVVESKPLNVFSPSLPKKRETFELSIPAHFVLYILSAHPHNTLGFQNKEQDENKDGVDNPEQS